ncbi:MAG: tryptophanase [bacterium]
MKFPAEPFKIKVVERIKTTTRQTREQLLRKGGFNMFEIPAEYIYVDLLTDSGTSALSDNQWAGLMVGDESYAGSRNFYHLEETVRDLTGYKFMIPTHQGRVAENLLFSILCSPGKIVPNNTHFDTTRANVKANGARALDLPVPEALDPALERPFKGNMNIGALEEILRKERANIPLVTCTVTNNSAGGQPVSMENIRAISKLCRSYEVPFFLDSARFAENCFFIREREPGYKNKSVKEIAREMFSYTDGTWMSCKKDGLSNIGGFIGLNDEELANRLKQKLILIEGFPHYGGLAGRDLEAVARGLVEGLDEDYLHYRTAQVRYLADSLHRGGVPVVKPAGGHAVFIDARRFASHIPQSQFPAQALVVAMYREAGIRAVEIGSLMFAETDPESGQIRYPGLELVRLAIPRRVYTTMHIHYVAESVLKIFHQRSKMRGLRIVYEAPILRHFTARMEEI